MSDKAKSRPGGNGRKHESAKLPHASERGIEGYAPSVRMAAIYGGVTDHLGAPTERERAAAKKARARVGAREPLPIMARNDVGGMTGPYDDDGANRVRMLDTFGTNSAVFMSRRVHDLQNMLTRSSEPDSADLPAVNDGLATIAAVAPENELEAMLAVQMAGTHALGCEMMGRAMRNTDIDRMNIYLNAATKLQRTFTAQIEALARMRGKGQQTVRVEHVTVEPGAQAIVGDVHHHHPKEKINGSAAGAGTRPPLPSPDPLGDGVPISGDGERPMSNARRREHRRAPRDPERAQARVLHPERDP